MSLSLFLLWCSYMCSNHLKDSLYKYCELVYFPGQTSVWFIFLDKQVCGLVSWTNKCVVLSWTNKCVVYFPGQTSVWFIFLDKQVCGLFSWTNKCVVLLDMDIYIHGHLIWSFQRYLHVRNITWHLCWYLNM